MDVFKKAKVVRLMTKDGKYLTASEDKKSVSLQTTLSVSSNANWSVECITSDNGLDKLQLWSCYGKTLQITSLKGTVRQMKNGKQSWFPGWEIRPLNTNSSTRAGVSKAFCLWTCECFLEANDPLKLILESVVADREKVYKLDWFVEVVEGVMELNDSLQVTPVQNQKDPDLIKKNPSCDSNVVVINYCVESGLLGSGRISHFNSGQNINGSGIQKNGDVNVKYEITNGQDININFK